MVVVPQRQLGSILLQRGKPKELDMLIWATPAPLKDVSHFSKLMELQ